MKRRAFILLGSTLLALPFLYTRTAFAAPFNWRFSSAHSKQPQAAGPISVLNAASAGQIVTQAKTELQKIKAMAADPKAREQHCNTLIPQLQKRLEELKKSEGALAQGSTAAQRQALAATLILIADAGLMVVGLVVPVLAPAAILTAVFLPTAKLAIQFLLTDPEPTTGAALIAKYEGSRIVYFGRLMKASSPGAATPAGLLQRLAGGLFNCLSLGYSAYSAYAANAANATAKQQLEQARGFASDFLAAYAEIIKSCATLTAVQQLAAEDTVIVLQDIQTAIEKNTVTLPPPA